MRQILQLLIVLIGVSIYSQTTTSKDPVYRASLSDLKLDNYPKDSTANALVLYEFGKSYVDRNEYDLRTEIKRKIKIFNKEGFDNANVTIYLYKSNSSTYEKVEDIFASTYTLENDKVVQTELDPKNIYREEYDENITMVKFTLPNIKEGSVITYSYKLESPYMRKYHGWEFQGRIPKLYSEYNTSIPGNWLYHIKLVGGKKLSTNTMDIEKQCLQMYNGASADCSVAKYIMKDIPAFIEEDYMTTESNYLARIEYELETFRGMDGTVKHYTKTWKDVDKELRTEKDIGRQLRKSIDVEELLSEDIINMSDPLEKAKAIYHFVQNAYTWNGEYRIFEDVSVKNLIKNKSGNISSINILLHSLLRDSGITVNPILLSTRNNGFATKLFPVFTDFNYLLVEASINDKKYLLDATDKFLNFGLVPYRCLNGYGRRIDFKKGSEWIDIKPPLKSSMLYMVDLSFDEQQNLVGSVKGKTTGYHALNSRKAYFPNEDAYVQNLQDKTIDIDISNHSVENSSKTSPSFTESYNVQYEAESISETIYLNPFLFPFFKENPFKLQERTYPIDFGYEDRYIYVLKFDLGDEYIVQENPESLVMSLPNKTGSITFSTKVVGNLVNMTFNISFNEAVYTPEYYPYLKEFMNKAVNIQTNSLIVLKKK
ncbi:DUF3857 domain-containing protein [Hyunsoonleella flava]|uniref:DUF3857 domain-containing protein n=1 Tax=Hyunsoonleella flava TaxID=2527939 RepID=A0A4Q9FGP8_9FLAO|nr:DUF3857 domain-containing protein [Hyunsoonleella flava]TBM99750.1 DUF3857 domain-containing protein [Hyunsoonleella flava]